MTSRKVGSLNIGEEMFGGEVRKYCSFFLSVTMLSSGQGGVVRTWLMFNRVRSGRAYVARHLGSHNCGSVGHTLVSLTLIILWAVRL